MNGYPDGRPDAEWPRYCALPRGHAAPHASFATGATGSRAHLVEHSPSKRAAIETAQTRVPCRGDSASVYRVTSSAPGQLVYRCWRDVFGLQWLEYNA